MTSPPLWQKRFRSPSVSFPVWAKDRPERAIYNSDQSGKWELYTWDLETDCRRQLTDRKEGTRGHGFTSAVIDPSGETVWWFDDRSGDELGHWIAQPFAGGEKRLAAPDLSDAYSVGLRASGSDLILGSSLPDGTRIHVVDAGGASREIYHHLQAAWLGDISRDGTLFALMHSEHGDLRHPSVRILDLSGQKVAEIGDGPDLGIVAHAWSPLRGDQRLLISHERFGVERPAIWSVETGCIEDLTLELPGEVTASWYPDAQMLLVVHSHHGRHELYRMNIGSKALLRLETPPGTIEDSRIRPDGELWYQWSDAASPDEVRGANRTVLQVEGAPAPPGVPFTDLWVGRVHSFVAEPAGDRPHPTVFLVHGGPEDHTRDLYYPPVQAWVDNGFAAVMVNYRGSTGYGKEWRDALTGRPGHTELEDLAAVYERVVGDGIADRDRMVITGRSWGGYLTLLALGVQPDRWSLGVAREPIGDCVALYEDEMEPVRLYDRALFGGTPDEVPDVYRKSSPITYVDQVVAPAFILMSDNDPRCPPRGNNNYIARLQELDKVHDVYRYEEGHGALRIEESIHQHELIFRFCARHLGTRSGSFD